MQIQLGQELGKGGEGAVFEISQSSTFVAKLYHEAPDQNKQAKLAFMAANGDAQLFQHAAWPQETLHARLGGPVIGFLMPKVAQREPVHHLYGPAHRRQSYPTASWEFLLLAARNTAAAFDTLHGHRHVIADVNQGNVMVGTDAQVTLIDCDSFQVNANGTLHFCEVGVGHFTPPELQGLSSFRGVTRTVNHDNFGLALLVFHLLFGGRHPYAGVPLQKEVGESLEGDIKAFRYAYSRDSTSRGIKPPPRSIPLTLVDDTMCAMFEAAFTEMGARGGRPSARDWVHSLGALRGRLKSCGVVSTMHIFPSHLRACPWCLLESEGIVYFIDASGGLGGVAFDMARVMRELNTAQPPEAVEIPVFDTSAVVATPLPAGVGIAVGIVLVRILIVLAAIGVVAAVPKTWLVVLIAAGMGLFATSGRGDTARNAERSRRQVAMTVASTHFTSVENHFRMEIGPEGFAAKKAKVLVLVDEHKKLASEEKKELDQMHSTAEARQRLQFFQRCFIDTASIKGIGASNKAALRSFGIETAADVNRHAVYSVRGFGRVKTQAMIEWRNDCERRFKFDPSQGVPMADRNAVRLKFANRRKALEGRITSSVNELRQFRQDASRRAGVLLPQLRDAAEKLAQAKADLAAV